MEAVSEQQLLVGALLRRGVRRQLMTAGYSFREDKGLLDSLFLVECTAEQYQVLPRWVGEFNVRT